MQNKYNRFLKNRLNTSLILSFSKYNFMSFAGVIKLSMLVLIINIIAIPSLLKAQNWEQISVIGSNQILSITEHNNRIFAVSADQIYESDENGNSWQPLPVIPITGSSFYTIYSYKGILYIGTVNEGIFRSADHGNSWGIMNTGLPQSAWGIVELAAIGDSLFAATDFNGVYVYNLSVNSGWKEYNTGLFQFGASSIFASGNCLVANLGYYLFVRSNNHSEWNTVFVDSTEIQRLFFDFIIQDNYLFAGTDNGIYRGSLEGTNWVSVDIDVFPTRDIGAFAVDGNRLYAALLFGGEHWIFSSDDYGDNWEIKAHEFSWLYDMLVFKNRIWAARLDGLWFNSIDRSTNIDEPVSSIPDNFYLSQNYPNPFNPSTKIEYSVPQNGFVSISVYNLLGQKISSLVNEYQQKGNYNIIFNAKDIPSGTYFYMIKTKDFTQTKKMVLLK